MISNKKNRLVLLGGGFLLGLLVGWLIWGAGIEIRVNRANQINKVNAVSRTGGSSTVKDIVDGDTLTLGSGEQVRLLGIDAPESGDNCFEEAKRGLADLVADKEIALTAGVEDEDKYDRLLRWVWVGDQNVNIELVKNGLVKAYLYGELEYADLLADSEAQARDELVGCLWSGESGFSDLLVIDYATAAKYVGETVRVTGVIDNVFRSADSNIFVNFCPSYKSCPFSAVIFKSDQHRFENLPDNSWVGREVEISGKIEEYESRAEIIISDPKQIFSE